MVSSGFSGSAGQPATLEYCSGTRFSKKSFFVDFSKSDLPDCAFASSCSW